MVVFEQPSSLGGTRDQLIGRWTSASVTASQGKLEMKFLAPFSSRFLNAKTYAGAFSDVIIPLFLAAGEPRKPVGGCREHAEQQSPLHRDLGHQETSQTGNPHKPKSEYMATTA